MEVWRIAFAPWFIAFYGVTFARENIAGSSLCQPKQSVMHHVTLVPEYFGCHIRWSSTLWICHYREIFICENLKLVYVSVHVRAWRFQRQWYVTGEGSYVNNIYWILPTTLVLKIPLFIDMIIFERFYATKCCRAHYTHSTMSLNSSLINAIWKAAEL